MEKTIEDQALDCLIELMELYHERFFTAEREEITGFQVAQFRLLLLLHNIPLVSMSRLGRVLYFSKPYMTTVVDSLIKEGLVERHPDLHDRRVINVSLTRKGDETLKSVKLRVREQMKKYISNLQESELKTLSTSGREFIRIVSKIH